tara:strand:- start:4 stop:285 length:282 start_codon:yes stop_codon:yes gene_type:complete
MKKKIHPDYHEIEVVMTDGSKFKTRSTWGKKGDILNLDIDPKTHPAWSGGEQKIVDTQGQISKFAKRFQNSYKPSAPSTPNNPKATDSSNNKK